MRGARSVEFAVFALASAALSIGARRTVGPFDEGELALAAYTFGLGHTPGSPLHAWLGYVASHVPGVDPAYGLTCLSAACGALTAAAAVRAAIALGARPPWFAGVVALAFALAGAPWEASTRVEVYPLAEALAAWAFATAAARDAPGRMGLLLGLSAAANPVVAAMGGVACLLLRPLGRADLVRAFIGGLAGLLPYVQLIVAPRIPDAFVFGDLRSPGATMAYLRGTEYAGNLAESPPARLDHALSLGRHLLVERAEFPRVLAGLAGVVLLGATRLRAGIACVAPVILGVFFVTSNRVFAPDVPDYLGYLGLGGTLLGVALAAGLGDLTGRQAAGPTVAGALALAAATSHPVIPERTRARDDATEALARAVLAEVPVNGVLVVEHDHLASPLLFLRGVRGERRDVALVFGGLLGSSWYVERLTQGPEALAPFAVHGEGGREGRLRRLVAAQGTRPVRFGELSLARTAGVTACPIGLTYAPAPCVARPAVDAFAALEGRFADCGAGCVDAEVVLPGAERLRAAEDLALGNPTAAFYLLALSLPTHERSAATAGFGAEALAATSPPPDVLARTRHALGSRRENARTARSWAERARRAERARPSP